MDDLISRRAAIDALGEEPLVWNDDDAEVAERNQWRRDVAAIKALLPVQPERKKGKWIRISDEPFADRFECSECGKLPPIENYEWRLSDYCPNCGADMRGEGE